PDVFDLNEDGKAFVLMEDVPPQFVSAAHDAFENCPVGAIMEDYKKQKS
ncbi:MAG: ferredoxin, partial [Eubacteriaceae bacterium]|nr:ferredoxin [Eubacteriaceae bacterium]